MRKAIVAVSSAVLVLVVGCLAADDGGEQSSPSSNLLTNETLRENATNMTTFTYNESLSWTEARYGTYDHYVVDGSNCIWIMEVAENATVTEVTLNGTATNGSIRQATHLDVRISGPNVHNRFAYWNIMPSPFNVSVEGWPSSDHQVYAFFEFHAQRDKTVRTGIGADVKVSITLDNAGQGSPEFRNAVCN